MNGEDRFIGQLTSYLDEYDGATPLPDTVRDAVRAELPRTKQASPARGPARYLTMVFSRSAPVALGVAAAALILAVGVFLFPGRDTGAPRDSEASPTATPVPSATGCEATTVRASGAGGRTLDVVWCADGVGQPTTIAFSMEASFEVGPDQYFPGDGTLWLRPPGGGAVALAFHADRSVDEVLADLRSRDGYVVTEDTTVTLGGATGVVVDVSLADGATADGAPPLIEDSDQSWTIQDGTFTRVWVVDVAGEVVMIAAGAQLADAVAEDLRTIEWDR